MINNNKDYLSNYESNISSYKDKIIYYEEKDKINTENYEKLSLTLKNIEEINKSTIDNLNKDIESLKRNS